jgi:hypothetical protein
LLCQRGGGVEPPARRRGIFALGACVKPHKEIEGK